MSYYVYQDQEYVAYNTSNMLCESLMKRLDDEPICDYDLLDGKVSVDLSVHLNSETNEIWIVYDFYILEFSNNGYDNPKLGQLEINMRNEMTRVETLELLDLISSQFPYIKTMMDLYQTLEKCDMHKLAIDFYCPGFLYIC